MAGAQDTIYLCNFRVSVDGDWLCLKELEDYGNAPDGNLRSPSPPPALKDVSPDGEITDVPDFCDFFTAMQHVESSLLKNTLRQNLFLC